MKLQIWREAGWKTILLQYNMVVLSVQTQLADLGRIPTSETELSLQRRLSCNQVEWHWQTTELCQFALLQHKGNGGTWVSGATLRWSLWEPLKGFQQESSQWDGGSSNHMVATRGAFNRGRHCNPRKEFLATGWQKVQTLTYNHRNRERWTELILRHILQVKQWDVWINYGELAAEAPPASVSLSWLG